VKALVLTNEFPPKVYGGAGMHVAELTSALRGQLDLDIRTFGEQEREQERAANRATGVFVTLAARDGNRYTARAHVVAIISAGDVALERQ